MITLGLCLTTEEAGGDPTFTHSTKVKTVGSTIYCPRNASDLCEGSATNWDVELLGFTATSRSFVISPLSSDPNSHTSDIVDDSSWSCIDDNGDGGCDFHYSWQTFSLEDLGTYSYEFIGHFIDANGDPATTGPCLDFMEIWNEPPTANITDSGTFAINNSVTLTANSDDPDGGTLTHRWRIVAPSGHAGSFGSPTSATTSLTFVNEDDIGTWQIELDVDDDEGERKTFSQTFEIANLSPNLSINGDSNIDALQTVTLSASTTTDPDGGPPLDLVWQILQQPTKSSVTPGVDFDDTASSISFVTTEAEIGDWQFKLTATDNENIPVEAVASFAVMNLEPEVTFDQPAFFEIDVFDTIHIENTTPDDPDGGVVTHEWVVLQAPSSAAEVPGSVISTSAQLTIPTIEIDAGTWIFKYTIEDTEDGADTKNIKVLVDAPVEADLVAPEFISVTALPLVLDGSGSVDPDSLDHDTTGAAPDISPGIVTYHWTLEEVPAEHFPAFIPGPVEYSMAVANNAPTLSLDFFDIEPGEWTFGLEVTDGENNKDFTTHHVIVLEANTPPIVQIAPAQYVLTDVSGFPLFPIIADASFSFDLDNLASEPLVPNLGITAYDWSMVSGPFTCPAIPPAVTNTTGLYEVFPFGFAIPTACHGSWTLAVVATDDDSPPLVGSAMQTVIIGNCPSFICIDAPTTENFHYVEFSDKTDVEILYHVNSAIYNNPIATAGLRLELQIFHESNLVTPVYTGQYDYDLLPFEDGGFVTAHWHGYRDDGTRPEGGKYSIAIRASNPVNTTPFEETVQTEAIWLEVLEVEATTESLLSINGAESAEDSLEVQFSVSAIFSSTDLYDEANLLIWPAGAPDTDPPLVSLPIPAPQSGQFDWNGELTPGTFIAPGDYKAAIEVKKAGLVRGISPSEPFTAYSLNLEVSGVAESDEESPGAVLELDGPARDMTVTLEPGTVAGTVFIRTIDNPGAFAVMDGGGSINTDGAGGAAFPDTDFAPDKTFQVEAVGSTPIPTRLEAEFVPDAGSLSQSAIDIANLHAMVFEAELAGAEPAAAENLGVFVQRNPETVTAANFDEHRYVMHPLTLRAEPVMGSSVVVSLTAVSGPAGAVRLFAADPPHAALSLPASWTETDFDPVTSSLELPLLVQGQDYGEVELELTYTSDGNLLETRKIKLRIGDLPGLAGRAAGAFPHFMYDRNINAGDSVFVALDPARFAARVGRAMSVNIVPHRDRATWATNDSLAPIVAPTTATLTGGTISGSQLGPFPIAAPGEYDIVYDFGNFSIDPAGFVADGTLDPGDIIDTIVLDRPSLLAFPPLTTNGPHGFASAEYGMGASPPTTHVPAGWDGLMTAFDFRLRGRIVWPNPLPVTPLPVIVMAHGNHTPRQIDLGGGFFTIDPAITSEENFRGHTYFQEFLASHGYVSVSVDLDEMVGKSSLGYVDIAGFGIMLRGNVVARNLDHFLANLSTLAGGVLAGAIDTGSIFLLGHSRGGEAVLYAEKLLHNVVADRPPGAPAFTTPESAIQGIISLAPMSVLTAAPQKPYLLVYGSADGDVNGASTPNAWPFQHFDRSTGPAHAIYILGANHNHWNTSWPSSDASEWVDTSTPPFTIKTSPNPVGAALVSELDQQEIAKGYVLAFLNTYYGGLPEYTAFFESEPSVLRPSGVPLVPLSRQHRPATAAITQVIDDYETEPSASTASSGFAVSPLFGLTIMYEDQLADTTLSSEADADNRFFQDTRGAILEWSSPGSYSFNFTLLSTIDLRGKTIAVRLAQQPQYTGATLNASTAIDLGLTIKDAGGQFVTMSLGSSSPLREIYQSWVIDRSTSPPTHGDESTKAVFETKIFPWWAFVADGQAIDLSAIEEISITVGSPTASGTIGIDNVEIWE